MNSIGIFWINDKLINPVEYMINQIVKEFYYGQEDLKYKALTLYQLLYYEDYINN